MARRDASSHHGGRGDEPGDTTSPHRGAPLYVVHVSCKEAIDPIAQARTNDWHAWGETCTQYLFIDETALDQPNFEGAKYVYTPPPRPKENQEHLWHALATDVLSVVSTDHCPFNWDGQKTLGRDDFSKIPNGGPGIENRLHMLHHFGVRQGRISLSRFVELVSTNPAKFFGMYPRKGTIAVGSDADIVVFDPEKRVKISAQTHHSNVDYNLFEGTGEAAPLRSCSSGDRSSSRATSSSGSPAPASS